jgi:hypothetical protein
LVTTPVLPASAQEIMPVDHCLEIDHFPQVPIGNAPSKVLVFITVPLEFAGGTLGFSFTGPSGDQQGSGAIDDRGLGGAEAPLFQFGEHMFTDVFVEVGGSRSELDPAELGDNGTFTVDESEPQCDPSTLTHASPTTTAPATTTTTTATTTTAAPTTTSTAPPAVTTTPGPAADGTGLAWPLAVIPFGLLLGLGGFLLARAAKDPCEELRKLWEAAERRVKLAEDALGKARRHLEERKARTAGAREELARLERSRLNSITERGVTYHLIEGGRVTTEGLEELIATHTRLVESAEATEAEAAKSVAEWEPRLERARAEAAEAKQAYERCVGERSNPVPGEVTTPGGPAVASSPEQVSGCEEGATEARPAGEAESINVTVDFSLIIEVDEGSERKVGEARALALDLTNLANELGTLGSLLGAFGSGSSVAGGVGGLRAGEYVEGAGGLVWGGITGYIAGADPNIGTQSFPVSIPTSPQEAATEVLEATARLGALVAQKVGEWMEMNQLYNIRLTFLYQSVTATPYQIWRCRAGRFKCAEQVYHYTVSGLQRRPGPHRGQFRLESDIARTQFQREIERMLAVARSNLEASARAKATFDARHRPGHCP